VRSTAHGLGPCSFLLKNKSKTINLSQFYKKAPSLSQIEP
jgi:hypothetical protein